MAQPVGISRPRLCGGLNETSDEPQLVFVDDMVHTGHLVGGLDGCVVERAATETVGRCAVEDGQQATTRRSRVVEGTFVGDPAVFLDAAQVGLHQLVLAREVLVEGAFGGVRRFGEPLHAGGVNAHPIEQGPRGGQDSLPRSGAGWCRGACMAHGSSIPIGFSMFNFIHRSHK